MKNQYKLMVILSFIIWLVETAYFGWNDTPQSNAEKVLDYLTWLLIIWGIIGDITSNLVINKVTKIRHVEHFTINNVEEFKPVKGGE